MVVLAWVNLVIPKVSCFFSFSPKFLFHVFFSLFLMKVLGLDWMVWHLKMMNGRDRRFFLFYCPPSFIISKSRKVSLWEYKSINNVEEVEVIQYSCRSNCEAWLALGHQRRHVVAIRVGGAVIEENHTNYCLNFFAKRSQRYANSVVS